MTQGVEVAAEKPEDPEGDMGEASVLDGGSSGGSQLPLRLADYLPDDCLAAFPNETLYEWQV
jgi:hypothetical protein